jgi:aspartyl protease family protein
MIRFDLQSAAVLGVALTLSCVTAVAVRRLDDGGQAQAATLEAVQPRASGTAAQVVRGPDGHYWAQARIDGRAVEVLVDTGATVVALTREDALRLGVDPEPDAFTRQVRTASGVARAAPVRLASVSVAGTRVEAVEALVVEEGLSYSLLGMSYLGRLSGFEATPHGLTLRP